VTRRDVSATEAKRIAKRFGVRVPRVGYEVSLGDKRWLSSTGHAQFGWFERPAVKAPFEVKCRCDEELRRGEPRGCAADCPVRTEARRARS
jgi:hypothetical protein